MNNELAHHYAVALLDLAKSDFSSLRHDLEKAEKILENEKVFSYLSSPRLGRNGRLDLSKIVFSSFSSPLKGLLLSLSMHRHISYFKDIKKATIELMDDKEGIERGIIWSVRPLKKEEIKGMEETLTRKEGHQVVLENRLDSSLKGGVCITLHEKRYDGSVKEKMRQLEHFLLKGGKYGQ